MCVAEMRNSCCCTGVVGSASNKSRNFAVVLVLPDDSEREMMNLRYDSHGVPTMVDVIHASKRHAMMSSPPTIRKKDKKRWGERGK